MRDSTALLRLALTLCIGLWLLFGRPSLAQPVPFPDLSHESLLDDLDVEALAYRFGLAPNDHLEVLIIVDEYAQWRRSIAKETEEKRLDIATRMDENQAKMTDESRRLVPEYFEKWRAATQEWKEHRQHAIELAEDMLRRQDAAIASIKQYLNVSQQQALDEVLRDIRRKRTCDWSPHFPVERADLVQIFLTSDLLSEPEKELVRPILERYAEDFDLALRQRNEHTRREPVEVMKDFAPTSVDAQINQPGHSPEELQALFAEQTNQRRARRIERLRPIMAAHRRVADVNLAYLRLCTDQLSPETGARAERAFLRVSYVFDGGIEAERAADDLFATVLALEDLSGTQRRAIESLRDDEWWPRRRSIESVLRRLVDKKAQEWERRAMTVSLDEWQNPIGEQQENRRLLEQEIIQRVVELLSESQRQQVKIPKV